MANELPPHNPERPTERNPRKRYYRQSDSLSVPQEINQKDVPENTETERQLQTARAITNRSKKEQQWRKNVAYAEMSRELPDEEETDSNVQEKEKKLIALFLTKVEGSESPDNFGELLKNYFDSVDEMQMDEELPSEMEELESFEDIKRLIQRKMKLQKRIRGESPIVQTILEANEFATEQGITQAEIFEDDDLYEELIRRHYLTPEYFAASRLRQVERISPDVLTQIAEVDIILERLFSRQSAEGIQEKAHSMREDSYTRLLIYEQTKVLKEVNRVLIRESIKRFWGEEEFQRLPPDIQQNLGITTEERDQ